MVDDACLVVLGVLVFGVAKQCPECVGAFEVYLYSFPFAYFPKHFPCPWHVWNHYGNVLFVGVVILWVVVGVVAVAGLVGVGELVVPLVEDPIWKLALL